MKFLEFTRVPWWHIHATRVARPVTEHLVVRGLGISGECSFEFHAPNGIVALLFAHPQKVESLKKMKK